MPHPDRRKYDNLSMEDKVDEILDMLLSLSEAFPEGPAKHREEHSSWLEAKRNEAEFWKELKLDITKNGIRGLLVVTLGLIILGLQVKIHEWFK